MLQFLTAPPPHCIQKYKVQTTSIHTTNSDKRIFTSWLKCPHYMWFHCMYMHLSLVTCTYASIEPHGWLPCSKQIELWTIHRPFYDKYSFIDESAA